MLVSYGAVSQILDVDKNIAQQHISPTIYQPWVPLPNACLSGAGARQGSDWTISRERVMRKLSHFNDRNFQSSRKTDSNSFGSTEVFNSTKIINYPNTLKSQTISP